MEPQLESNPEVRIEEIFDEERLKEASELISEYSWGKDYPLHPFDEIKIAEHRIGAFSSDKLVGFGSVGRGFSPDERDNDSLWLAHVVIDPEFREQGIFSKIYDEQIKYAEAQDCRILSCTDNPVMESFFFKHGWQKVRDTVDEGGEKTTIFEFIRKNEVSH